jgi:hypothetical protein
MVCPRSSHLVELLRRPPRFVGGYGVVPVKDPLRTSAVAPRLDSGPLRGRNLTKPSFTGRRLVAEGTLLRAGILELANQFNRNELATCVSIVKF